MSADRLSTFESSAESTTVERVTTETFDEVLTEHLKPPAVGVPLPFDGVTLSGTGVTTDFSPADLRAATTGVTPAGIGIADYGTVTVRSRPAGDELVALYPERHIAVLAARDVVPDMTTALDRIGDDFARGQDSQVMATGPSSTADLGALIEGVHGPMDVRVVILEDRE